MVVTSLAALQGEWTLHRVIDDAKAGQTATLEGRADLRRDGAGWRYHESGLLSLPGRPAMQAERVYLFDETGGDVCVRFADGRPFHRFTWQKPQAVHDCPPDIYKVQYAFTLPKSWRAIWQVSGPRKDYVMTSDYTRP